MKKLPEWINENLEYRNKIFWTPEINSYSNLSDIKNPIKPEILFYSIHRIIVDHCEILTTKQDSKGFRFDAIFKANGNTHARAASGRTYEEAIVKLCQEMSGCG